jgi:hypothetical protein
VEIIGDSWQYDILFKIKRRYPLQLQAVSRGILHRDGTASSEFVSQKTAGTEHCLPTGLNVRQLSNPVSDPSTIQYCLR